MDARASEGVAPPVYARLHAAISASVEGKPPKGWGSVYFVGSGRREDPVKIGFTAGKPEERIRSLQTASAYKLFILAREYGPFALESAYHQVFAETRLHGEWFRRTPALDALIDAKGL